MARNKPAEARENDAEQAEPTESAGAKGGQGEPLPALVASHQVIKRGQRGRTPRTPLAAQKPAEPAERVEPPKAKRYRVTAGGRIADNGMPQNLSTGKVITDVQYNIKSLHEQGIGLEELDDEPESAVA